MASIRFPGSSNDWNTVHNHARLYNKNCQVMLSSSEMPLMQFGNINTGRHKAEVKPESSHIFGWPMKNCWENNFNAFQFGGHEWIYTISGSNNSSSTEAVRFGWGKRTPFLSRVLPGGGKGESVWSGSFIKGWSDNLLLESATSTKDGQSAILHLRETDGKNTVLALKNGSNEIKPFESQFIMTMINE